jgi:hypothetical protein
LIKETNGGFKMADGIALVEINTKGEGKLKTLSYFDFRLEHINFEDSEGLDQLMGQLPKDMNDVLVSVIFGYQCTHSQGFEDEIDYEEIFNIVSYTVVKKNYKELYRELITEELISGINGFQNINAADDLIFQDNYYKEIVAEWSEFYGEEFKPTHKESNENNDTNKISDNFEFEI